jgi:glycosyltransferase involved in cell wall biosynthesis
MTKVSICIPAYSRLNYLATLVDSCLKQSYSDYEICISQDVTPNGLHQGVQEYCELLVLKYPNLIRYHAQEKNLGLAGNWNALIKMAQGEYCFIPGDDDLIVPDFIEKMVSRPGNNFDVVFCNQDFMNESGEYLNEKTEKLNWHYGRSKLQTGVLNEPIRNVLQSTIPISASLIKREWFNTIHFDERINTPELEVFLKIAIKGGIFFYINEKLALFRLHSQSATSSGLTIGQYLVNLINIEVSDNYEADKYGLISKAIIPGINNALRLKHKGNARKLLKSGYYPAGQQVKKLIQMILIGMPSPISHFLLTKLK